MSMIDSPVLLVQILGFGGFIWLALYVWARAQRRSALIVVSVVGLLAQAAFWGASALGQQVSTIQQVIGLERWSWWTAVLPLAMWFWVSSLVAGQANITPILQRWCRWIVGGSAVLLIIVGSTTSLLLNYGTPIRLGSGGLSIGPGRLYWLYVVWVLGSGLGALLNLGQAWRVLHRRATATSVRQPLALMLVGALLFAGGAGWLVLRFVAGLALPSLPGDGAVMLGGLALGYGVARFGLLLDGQDVRRDLLASMLEILVLQTVYLGLLALIDELSLPLVLLVIGLVVATHMGLDGLRSVLDRGVFSRAERRERADARSYATALGTTPIEPPSLSVPDSAASPHMADLPTPKQFKDDLRRAISALKSPPKLARSPLLTLPQVSERLQTAELHDDRLARAAVLRELLIEQIMLLRPFDDDVPMLGDAWRFYNVLYYPYVHGVSRKHALVEAQRLTRQQRQPELAAVLRWLADVDENTFYKWQRRASDTIAANLAEGIRNKG